MLISAGSENRRACAALLSASWFACQVRTTTFIRSACDAAW
jgi:hypothetical protein